jgi:hypothetical protein
MNDGLRRRLAIMLVGLMVGFTSLASPPLHAAGEGRIEGTIVNGTAGAAAPAGLPVTLHVFRDRTRIGEEVVQTDQNGRFVVESLDVGANYVYFPVAEYGGASYFPERPVNLDDAPSKSVEVRVFEPTDSDEAIRFDRSNLLIMGVSDTSLTIMEMGAVVNQSDRTYVAQPGDGAGTTLRFTLPRGAAQVAPQAGFSASGITAMPDGFASSDPVLPGRHEIAFSYRLPVQGSTIDIAKRQQYPTRVFNLYAPESGLTVVTPSLTYQGGTELGGQRFQLYSAQNLTEGATVTIRLAGLPWAFRPTPLQIGLGVVGLGAAIIVAALLFQLRRPVTSARPRVATKNGVLTQHREDSLLESLVDLDDRFARGEIAEQVYRSERDATKRTLVELLRPVSRDR